MCGDVRRTLCRADAALRPGPARPGSAWAGFVGGRLLGYMVAGAAVAASVAMFCALGDMAPALRPLWVAAHAAALALGVWLIVTGRLPDWFGAIGRAEPPRAGGAAWQRVSGPVRAAVRQRVSGPLRAAGRQRVNVPLRAAGLGVLWAALPCGLLQSALIVAALANTPLQGALAMGAFATTSSVGLTGYSALWASASVNAKAGVWAIRVSGAVLLGTSTWALAHGLWQRVAALCAAL